MRSDRPDRASMLNAIQDILNSAKPKRSYVSRRTERAKSDKDLCKAPPCIPVPNFNVNGNNNVSVVCILPSQEGSAAYTQLLSAIGRALDQRSDSQGF